MAEMTLKYTRQAWFGTYYAHTDTHTFAIDRVRGKWDVRIWTKTPSPPDAFDEYKPGFRTMADAKDFAQSFADENQES